MIKKVNLSIILLITSIFLVSPSLYSEEAAGGQSEITYFSSKSFYFYAMGSPNHFAPPADYFQELGSDSGEAFAPVLGIGYRLVNIKDRFFLNLEGDYSSGDYNFGEIARKQKINLLNFMLNFEWHLKNSPASLFFGMGVGFFNLPELAFYDYLGIYTGVPDENITALSLTFGVKFPVSKHMVIRGEFRWFGEYYGQYYDDYWDEYYDESDWDFLSSALCIGIELHL